MNTLLPLYRKLLFLVGAIAALASFALGPVQGQDLNKAKETTIFLGPYTLAQLGYFAKHFERDDGPDEANAQNALAQCKFYFVDKRVRRDGKWVFSDEEGYPKVLVEGLFSHKLTDKNGRDFVIHVKEFVAARDFPKDVPADSCRGHVGVTVIVKREFGTDGYSTETSSHSRKLRYNIEGGTKGFETVKEK